MCMRATCHVAVLPCITAAHTQVAVFLCCSYQISESFQICSESRPCAFVSQLFVGYLCDWVQYSTCCHPFKCHAILYNWQPCNCVSAVRQRPRSWQSSVLPSVALLKWRPSIHKTSVVSHPIRLWSVIVCAHGSAHWGAIAMY